MQQPLYQTAFSVEEVNRRAAEGTPFRDAYKAVAQEIADGTFRCSGTLRHTHEGSIGNLCNRQISSRMDELTAGFPFASINKALAALAGTC